MSKKNKERIKKAWRIFLKCIMTKTMYCIHVEKKHNMEYRSTIVDNTYFTGPRPVHINICDNCKYVLFVAA